MKKVVLYSLRLILAIAIVLNLLTIFSFAADNFDISGIEAITATSAIKSPFVDGVGAVLDIVRIAGTGIALIMMIAVGIKYMSAAPGERADLKKSSVQYVVGAVILFGASNLLGVIVDVSKEMLK